MVSLKGPSNLHFTSHSAALVSVLLKDISTLGQEKTEIEAPTLQLVDNAPPGPQLQTNSN